MSGLPKVPSTAAPSENRPTAADLATAGQIPIFDAAGRELPFHALYEVKKTEDDGTVIESSSITMVVFIRHFYCSTCQAYISALTESITPQSLTISVPRKKIFVVGCGSHTLIKNYISETRCPFPIYAEPTQRLHTILGMSRTLAIGEKPKYLEGKGVLGMVKKGVAQGLTWGGAFKGGDIQQVGGEFLFVDGDCVWCHRMKTTRDHTEIGEFRKAIGIDDAHGTPNIIGDRSTFFDSPSP
ncbi:AhpC/TSA antioxidant enzyme-domain-containing protein [Peziza echinospora]|nr:AhpC/TSA antioxidant enzyme-domain-containing protein [Peziza echinospora]